MATLSQFYRNILNVGSATLQEGTNVNDPLPVWTLPLGAQHYYNGLDGNDTITNLLPLAGNSYIEGGKGADTLTGGLLTEDTVGYLNSQFAVNVTLTAAGGITLNAQSGDAVGDITAAGFENLVGSMGDDFLRGNSFSNKILGMGGIDSISGNGGDDWLYGGDGSDQLNGGDGNDQLYGENGNDIISGNAGNDIFDGGLGNDTMHGGDGDDVFIVGAGNNTDGKDYFRGQSGIDTVDYSASTGPDGIEVRLDSEPGEDGLGYYDAAGDRYESIENVVGSARNDDIWGGSSINTMWGGAGRDRYRYEELANLNGDVVRDLNTEEGDVIKLEGIRDPQITELRNVPGHYADFTVEAGSQSGTIRVYYTPQVVGFPDVDTVFGL
ncbi:calcium-binding protein [Phyllobacterium chamaecytisi]|uniref:calcium-binding protein n=1 Tax=Phyllobacterium chamaecytisi TaxID=2876082 RepID=UPI001CCB6340|nr:calcium-binding protein [Phyllobacterium sp. KW56]MBZ9604403.1 hypothetical protein [Phyllobacterium sp. KW56]